MKNTLRIPILLSTAFVLATGMSRASTPIADGDLAVCFYSLTGSGSSAVFGTNYYVLNLGPASLYRENTLNNVPVSTINSSIASSNVAADLSALFGSTWAEDGEVRWCVVGTVKNTSPGVSGDPATTNYLSARRASLDTGTTGADPATTFPTSISASNRNGLNGNINSFLQSGVNPAINGTGGYTSIPGANAAGVRLTTSNTITLKTYVPPTTATYFTLGHNPTHTLATGQLDGSAGVEGALDIFRVLHSTSGADLTAGASAGNAAVGAGQFIGSLTLDASGNLKIQGVGAANPDSDHDGMPDSWENTYFGGLTQGAADDFDKDGTDNLTEYRLNIVPNSATSRFAATRAASGLISWPSVTGVTFKVLRSTTLAAGDWTEIATLPGTAGTANYTDPTPPTGKAFYRVGLQP